MRRRRSVNTEPEKPEKKYLDVTLTGYEGNVKMTVKSRQYIDKNIITEKRVEKTMPDGSIKEEYLWRPADISMDDVHFSNGPEIGKNGQFSFNNASEEEAKQSLEDTIERLKEYMKNRKTSK